MRGSKLPICRCCSIFCRFRLFSFSLLLLAAIFSTENVRRANPNNSNFFHHDLLRLNETEFVTAWNGGRAECNFLFASVLVIQDFGSTRGKAQLDELILHHKSIDLTYAFVDVCKVVITDHATATHLLSAKWSKFYLYVSEVGIQSWYSDQEISASFVAAGIKLNLHFMFLNSFANSASHIVLIDTDTLVLRNLHEVFERYPKFGIGFTLSSSFFTKQDPNYYLNTGVIFIRKGLGKLPANFLNNIINFMRGDELEMKKAKIYDQAAVFHFLEKHCIRGACNFFGRRMGGECIIVKNGENESKTLRVLFLGSEFNTVAIKMYKESYIAHFSGIRKPLMKTRGEYLFQHGAESFKQKYAKRILDKSVISPRATWCNKVR